MPTVASFGVGVGLADLLGTRAIPEYAAAVSFAGAAPGLRAGAVPRPRAGFARTFIVAQGAGEDQGRSWSRAGEAPAMTAREHGGEMGGGGVTDHTPLAGTGKGPAQELCLTCLCARS
jgi:hypothetical protein